MNRNARRAIRNAAIVAAIITPLGGCYSASGTQLGRHNNQVVTDSLTAGDALGAAMFAQHVHIAAAESRRQRDTRRGYATANVDVD